MSKEIQQPDEIIQREIFIVQMYEIVKSGRISDLDTDWRMTEKILPPSLDCHHKKDSAEISGNYRKIHLSDILSAAVDILDYYHGKQAPERKYSGCEFSADVHKAINEGRRASPCLGCGYDTYSAKKKVIQI